MRSNLSGVEIPGNLTGDLNFALSVDLHNKFGISCRFAR